jgi:uncharacterized protein YggL (DUF469 family)
MAAPCPTFGFLVELDLDATLSADEVESSIRAFQSLLEQRGLVGDRGTGASQWTYRIQSEAAQATDADRSAIAEWVSKRRGLRSFRVGELFELPAPV